MDKFHEILADPHSYAREWKAKTGGKVLGYFSDYVPEEIVYAAGVLPVRILFKPDTEGLSQRYLYGAFCPYSLGILSTGLKGEYDYLDGMAHAEDCMPIRGAVANWWDQVETTGYHYYLAVPSQLDSPSAKDLMYSEMVNFRKDIEKWTGKEVSDEAVNRAIDVYNTNRLLMRQIYELRRLHNPPLTGVEAFEMIMAGQVMDKEDHNKLLHEAIASLAGKTVEVNENPRFMLLGSEIGDTSMVELIETSGGLIVADRLSMGSNYIWNNVVPQTDPMLAIGNRYMDKPRSPVKDESFRRRVNEIVAMAIDYDVQGVVYLIHRFCIPHQQDRPAILKAFEQRLIPVHEIEYDGTVQEQDYRNRIRSFVDMIKQ